jgi:hypothetical protein
MKRSSEMISFDKTPSSVQGHLVTKKKKHANKEKQRRGDLNTSYGELMGLLMQVDPEVGGNVGDTDNSKRCIPTVVPVENLLPRRALINRAVAMITSLHEKNKNLRSMVEGPVAEEETTTTCGELPQEHPNCDKNSSRMPDSMTLSNSNFQTPLSQYEPKQNNNSHRIDSLSVLNPPVTSNVLLREHQNHDESYFRMPELTVSSNSNYESRRYGGMSQCEPMQNNNPHQMNSLSILGQYLQQVQALNTRSDMLEKQLSSDLPITNTNYVNENRCYEPQYNNGTSQACTAILHALALQQQN